MVEGRAWKPTEMASSMAATKSIAAATFAVPPGCSPSPPIGAVFRNLPRKCQCDCACVWFENGRTKRTLRVFFPHGVNFFKQRRWPISAVGSGDFPCASQHLSISENKVAEHNMKIGDTNPAKINRRVATAALGLSLLSSSHNINMNEAIGAGLPPEDKPRLCDADCEKELENVSMVTAESGLQYKDITVGTGPSPPIGFQVAANYVAMVPSGQIFDSSLEKGQPYLFRVGSGQVIKGLDEGILSMKVGGKRRLYIPGSLSFPKGLNSAPGRPRVPPNSPVIFYVSLEYIPVLDLDLGV